MCTCTCVMWLIKVNIQLMHSKDTDRLLLDLKTEGKIIGHGHLKEVVPLRDPVSLSRDSPPPYPSPPQ